MYQDTLQRQKQFLETVNRKGLIKRDIEEFAVEQLENKLIKVILGARRIGKSTLALQMLEGKNFGYTNFDDASIDLEHFDYIEYAKSLDEVFGSPKYIFLDEVQNLPDWERVVNSLHREGKNLIITGSNAQLLSSEIATVLTGRTVEIMLLPLSIEELKSAGKYRSVDEIFESGLYPEPLMDNVSTELYYSSLLSSTIIKDIVVRYSLRNITELENVAKYLLSNISNLFTANSIGNKLGVSIPSVQSYINYLENSYIFYTLPKFSFKQSEVLRNPRKVYVNDILFSKSAHASSGMGMGASFENLFFMQLLHDGYVPGKSLFYWQDRSNNEIDFVAVDGRSALKLYQVVYSVADEKTVQREVRSFEGFKAPEGFEVERYVVTESEEGFRVGNARR